MKKVLLGVALVSSLAMAEGFVVEPKIGFDLNNVSLGNGLKLKRAASLGAEVRMEALQNLEVGGGIEIIAKSVKNTKSPDKVKKSFKSIPVYLVGKYSFDEVNGVKPYVKGKLGYAFNNFKYESEKGGNVVSGGTSPVGIPGGVAQAQTPKSKTVKKAGNGVYLGIGAGVEYKNWNVDLSYNVNRFPLKTEKITDVGGPDQKYAKEKKSINNSAITLNVGYSFEF